MDRRHFLGLSAASLAMASYGSNNSGLTPPLLPSTNSILPDSEWQKLANDIEGNLILPTQGNDYQRARVVFNSRFDHVYPQAIARCASEDDVIAALAFVQKHGLHVTSRCGGHGYTGDSTTTGLIIDLSPINTISVDKTTATIGAGTRLVDVYDQLSNQGVGIPLGSCLSVGVAGLTLGGGFGVVDRAYGLTCDNLLSADVITVDGTKLTCNETVEPDLFWALRGGGVGNFGIVTSFTFKTYPISDMTVFEAYFSFNDFEEVMAEWQKTPSSWPDAMWGQVIINWTGGGFPIVYVRAFCVNSETEATPYWQQFLSAVTAKPIETKVSTDTYRNTMLGTCSETIPACHLSVHFADGRMPRSAIAASSDLFDKIVPPAGISALKIFIEESRSKGHWGMIIFNPMGGAIDNFMPTDTAFVHRNALFEAQYTSIFEAGTSAETIGQAQVWENSFRDLMQPWSTGGAYVNYADPLIEDWQQAYYGDNYSQLAKIKRRYDPKQVFKMSQGIEPTPANDTRK